MRQRYFDSTQWKYRCDFSSTRSPDCDNLWVLLECMNWLIYFASAFLGRSSSAASMLYVRFKSQTARYIGMFRIWIGNGMIGTAVVSGAFEWKIQWKWKQNKNKKKNRIYLGEYKKHMLILIVLSNRTNERTSKIEKEERKRVYSRLDPWDVTHSLIRTHTQLNTTGIRVGFLIVSDFSSNQMNEYLIRSSPNFDAGIRLDPTLYRLRK